MTKNIIVKFTAILSVLALFTVSQVYAIGPATVVGEAQDQVNEVKKDKLVETVTASPGAIISSVEEPGSGAVIDVMDEVESEKISRVGDAIDNSRPLNVRPSRVARPVH